MTFTVILIVVLVLLGYLWTEEQSHQDFDEQWPSIDDDEFLRRCAADTPPQIALGVRRIVSEQLSIPYQQIYPEQNFIDDLKAD
ncbi:hypothetical protein OAK47_03015 [Planctomycetaceae bacterium]|jgi:hypothetical protein|nr:hypothetical protein [Planctomycetaceae bacterium]MDC0273394.1 hypothetical protein [Planctomycetaceae bacterium]MDC0307734.1 hypothetical protein [Planctomycetaceae bacterium]MDG2389298.1 hypothetical protein [Planctomycetaceae bacterium]